MRYFIIFGVTIILALFIKFYNPNSEYLGVYDKDVCIEYNYNQDGYYWIYDSDKDINVKQKDDSKWVLSSNKDGEYKISFYYINNLEKNMDDYLYKIDYIFEFKNNKIYWKYGEGFGLLNFPDPF